ncbi:MAG: hypothetical protein KKH28_14730 [Elusimicrobia bacterium]|nr:hypothetical protein [Elusimicrobiota bacterium]
MYKHTQKSDLMVFTSMLMLGGAAAASYFLKQSLVFYPFAIAALFVYFGFKDLTVEVDEVSVRFRFGVGWFKKAFRFQDVESARAVRNSWLCGWGIHYIGKGWLYNVSGLDAVELKLKNGKTARIGTDEPHLLETEIRRRLTSSQPRK